MNANLRIPVQRMSEDVSDYNGSEELQSETDLSAMWQQQYKSNILSSHYRDKNTRFLQSIASQEEMREYGITIDAYVTCQDCNTAFNIDLLYLTRWVECPLCNKFIEVKIER